MTTARKIADRLRERILAGIYAGRLDPGDRLLSIRALAEEFDADHRTIAKAYRTLADEDLVRIRPRSGVYVAPMDQIGREAPIPSETADWMARMGGEAWLRRIPFDELAELVRRCLASRPWRCLVAESTTDSLAMLARELETYFALDVRPIRIEGAFDELDEEAEGRLREALGSADLAVTSVYHFEAIERLTDVTGVPLVGTRLNPDWIDHLRRRKAEAGGLTIVVDDRRTGERLADAIEVEIDSIEVVTPEEIEEGASLDPDVPVYLSAAAGEKLGEIDHPDVIDSPPAYSKESALSVSRTIVWLSLVHGPCD